MFMVAWTFRSRKRRIVCAIGALLVLVSLALHILGLPVESSSWRLREYDALQTASTGQQVQRIAADLQASATATRNTSQSEKNISRPTPSFEASTSTKGVPVTESQAAETRSECNWANFTVTGPPYFLTAVFIVRIYENDLSEMTTAHIKQWLVYLRYAGVEHVYLYDLWYLPGEAQREALDVFIKEGYLTYTDRHELNPYVRQKSQLPSYQQCIDEYGKDTIWQAAIDIDEYPFSPSDTSPGFLHRFVKKFNEQHPDVSEITMENFLYLGEKNKSRELLIEQLWRHTHGPANALVKPIYKPADIKKAQVHHNYRRRGRTKSALITELRLNHYWGARLQNWGPDTKQSLAKTEEDRGVKPIVVAFKRCEAYIRHYLS